MVRQDPCPFSTLMIEMAEREREKRKEPHRAFSLTPDMHLPVDHLPMDPSDHKSKTKSTNGQRHYILYVVKTLWPPGPRERRAEDTPQQLYSSIAHHPHHPDTSVTLCHSPCGVIHLVMSFSPRSRLRSVASLRKLARIILPGNEVARRSRNETRASAQPTHHTATIYRTS